MPQSDVSVIARDVSWRVGYRWIVKGVSLAVGSGETALLVGGNGSGKTSLLRLLAGLTRASRGSVERRGGVGFVAHHSMLYDALTGRENLLFAMRLVRRVDPGVVADVLNRVGLAKAADQRLATYSRGMTQRLAIGRMLLAEPGVLLLDEPLTGLDDAAAEMVRDVLDERRQSGGAVVVASHQLVELVDKADVVGHLVAGTLAAWEPMAGRTARQVIERHRELAAGG